jgi:uncharacterized protein (DUF2164 family)
MINEIGLILAEMSKNKPLKIITPSKTLGVYWYDQGIHYLKCEICNRTLKNKKFEIIYRHIKIHRFSE